MPDNGGRAIGREHSSGGVPVDLEPAAPLPERQLSSSDPYHRVRLFSREGLPSLESGVDAIHDYVAEKARSVGSKIKRNRGRPATSTKDHNMLSVEEKAIAILGTSIAIPLSDVKRRINELRALKGETPMDRPPNSLYLVGLRHREIVAAIQQDVLRALEAFAPLVSGHERIVWRARMMEFYRSNIFRVLSLPDDHVVGSTVRGDPKLIDEEWRLKKVRELERAMQPHLLFFDKLGMSPDMEALTSTPAELLEKARSSSAERAIEAAFESGEISDTERIDRLRALKNAE